MGPHAAPQFLTETDFEYGQRSIFSGSQSLEFLLRTPALNSTNVCSHKPYRIASWAILLRKYLLYCPNPYVNIFIIRKI